MAELAGTGGTTYILPSISITKEATTAISVEAANLASGTMNNRDVHFCSGEMNNRDVHFCSGEICIYQ